MRYLILCGFALLVGCVQPSDTRGMCRDLEVCVTENDEEQCDVSRIWFECNLEVDTSCYWTEFNSTYRAPNDMAVSCEACDPNQCP